MKGNKKIIDILNGLLAGELTAVDQYLIHGEMYADFGFVHLAEKALHESEHERLHARALIQRILFLEGLPNLQNLGKLLIGENVVECLEGDLKYERQIQHPLLLESIALCEELQDYVSRDLLEDLLEHCEEAIDWLETQHSLIKDVTLANYLQTHMEAAGD